MLLRFFCSHIRTSKAFSLFLQIILICILRKSSYNMSDVSKKRKRLSLGLCKSRKGKQVTKTLVADECHKKMKAGLEHTLKTNDGSLKYCPTCQFPFENLRISPEIHCSLCNVCFDGLTECEDGDKCCNSSIFHYRDFAHRTLAVSRSGSAPSLVDPQILNNSSPKSSKKIVDPCQTMHNIEMLDTSEISSNLSEDTGKNIGTKLENMCDVSSQNLDDETSKLETDRQVEACTSQTSDSSVMSLETATLEMEAEFDSVMLNFYDKLKKEGVFDAGTEKSESNSCRASDNQRTDSEEGRSHTKLQWSNLMSLMRTDNSTGILLQPKHMENSVVVPGSFKGRSRGCPFYKRIIDTNFVVDAFSYGIIPGVSAYFLTHFHSDHYGGLRKSFNQVIYCSSVTAALVRLKIKVDEQYLRIINVDETRNIDGVLVTALDANHCPGSVMFLFQLSDGRNILHVGDFRADPIMESYSALWRLKIDVLYLDTTYCEPRYTFPTQQHIIEEIVKVVQQYVKKIPDTLIVCGTYSVGKEKVFNAVAKALDCKLWARTEKRKILECLQDETIKDKLVKDPHDARVHVYPMGEINFQNLTEYLQTFSKKFTHILAVKPTGWEMRKKQLVDVSTRGHVTICGAPYSEHSSYSELERFVKFLKPARIVPTVNVSSSAKLAKHFEKWLSVDCKPKQEQNTLVQTKLTRFLINS